jgi:hypothetical protein
VAEQLGDSAGTGKRMLLAKAAGAFLLLAAAFVGVALYLQIEAVDERVVSLAERKTKAVFEAHPEELAAPFEAGARATLEQFAEGLLDNQFVAVELYDWAMRPLAEAKRRASEAVERRVDQIRHDFPTDNRPRYRRHFIDNGVYVQVFVPILAAGTRRVGYFEGLYEVPADVVAGLWRRVVWSLILGVLAAAVVTALLVRLILRP